MIFSPTGGLIYHARALRYQKRLWAPFRAELGDWLSGWTPRERSLLLIGPSGGYCLERRFLDRFERLAAVDPDPIAKRIFASRFRRKIHWSHRDHFSPRGGRFGIEGFRELLAAHPGHAVLFCNFLGQLPFLDTQAALGETYPQWKRALAQALDGHSWATFHDRLSGPLAPKNLPEHNEFTDIINDARVVETFYTAPSGEGRIELADHLSGDLFPGCPRRFFAWQIRPGTWHLIEAVRNQKKAW